MMRILVFLLSLLPTAVLSQGVATLIADSVVINGQQQLIATGNVVAHHDGTRLSAEQIMYDQNSDRMIITGPIVVTDRDGTTFTADQANLDPQLQNGILQGARLVLDQQLQIAANRIDTVDGRYAQLYKTVATSCQVCGTKAPLWDIRAERVIHDRQEQQLYFQNAVLRIRGFPIVWLPRMRLPDPSLKRASGFLIPSQRSTTQLNTGIKTPYFITLGDHRDLTVTPYVSPETRTLEFRYRQAFENGDLVADTAISDDSLTDDAYRSYIFANGNFLFGADYQFRFDIEAVSDPAYLLDYGYSGKDRLDSAISLLRVTDTTLTQAKLTYYQTLRDDESNASLPPIVANVGYETRVSPSLGGTLTLAATADAAYRYSTTDGAAGRDVLRAGVSGDWQKDWVLPGGAVVDTTSSITADVYKIGNDTAFQAASLRATPSVGITLRWPLVRHNTAGTAHVIEPVVALGWSEILGDDVPNEDSTRTELDQANLLAMSRFSGEDVVETGKRAAVGASWTRIGTGGVTSALTFGRVYRDTALSDFSPSSGLDGERSDWLVAGQIVNSNGFLFEGRTLFDDNADPTIASSRVAWNNPLVSLSAAYIWQANDPTEDRPDTVSEWTVDAGVQVTPAWKVSVDGRYDVAEDRPVRAGLNVEWRNECVTLDLSASRRYTSSTTVDPTTTYGITGSLNGFSAGRSGGGPAAKCRP